MSRADDLKTILAHQRVSEARDDAVHAVVAEMGFDAFTDEAIALMASSYQALASEPPQRVPEAVQ